MSNELSFSHFPKPTTPGCEPFVSINLGSMGVHATQFLSSVEDLESLISELTSGIEKAKVVLEIAKEIAASKAEGKVA